MYAQSVGEGDSFCPLATFVLDAVAAALTCSEQRLTDPLRIGAHRENRPATKATMPVHHQPGPRACGLGAWGPDGASGVTESLVDRLLDKAWLADLGTHALRICPSGYAAVSSRIAYRFPAAVGWPMTMGPVFRCT